MARPRPSAPAVLVVLLGAFLILPGCLSLTAAQVPGTLLQGSSGNGWAFNASKSDARPQTQDAGLVSFQTLAYTDPGKQGGYPASLSVTTLQTLLSPSASELRSRIQDRVRSMVEARGVNLSRDVAQGHRMVAQGYDSLYFVFDGNVTGSSGFFTAGAHVKVLGEVWTCGSSRTSVAAVAIAQTSSVQYVAGSPVATRTDQTNWQEIVADPQGTIGGVQGPNGLVYRIVC